MKLVKDTDNKVLDNNKVSDKEAEEAFIKILTYRTNHFLSSLKHIHVA